MKLLRKKKCKFESYIVISKKFFLLVSYIYRIIHYQEIFQFISEIQNKLIFYKVNKCFGIKCSISITIEYSICYCTNQTFIYIFIGEQFIRVFIFTGEQLYLLLVCWYNPYSYKNKRFILRTPYILHAQIAQASNIPNFIFF